MSTDLLLLLKAFSWRLVGTLDTFVVAWLVTGEPTVAISISAVEFFTKLALYWLHERAWLNVMRRL